MNHSEYDQNKQLLVTLFTGDIELTEVLSYIQSIGLNMDYSRNINILIDARESKSLYSIKGVTEISKVSKKAFQHYTGARLAIIESNPIETVLSIIYQKITKPTNYTFKIFSTKEAALRWLSK